MTWNRYSYLIPLIISSLTLIHSFPIVEKRAVCVAMVDEILYNLMKGNLARTFPSAIRYATFFSVNSLLLKCKHKQNHRDLYYASSELRTMEILDGVCERMRYYYENEDAKDEETSKKFVVDKFNVDRGALTGNQLHLLTKQARVLTLHRKSRTIVIPSWKPCATIWLNHYGKRVNLYEAFCRDHEERCTEASDRGSSVVQRISSKCTSVGSIIWIESIEILLESILICREAIVRVKGYNEKAHKLYEDMIRRSCDACCREWRGSSNGDRSYTQGNAKSLRTRARRRISVRLNTCKSAQR